MGNLRLTFTDSSGETRSEVVSADRFKIGRHSENDLAVLDSRLSREHALITTDEYGSFLIEDLGSFNGTKVNGEEVLMPVPLCIGDTLDLGGVKFAVEEDQPRSNVPEEPDQTKSESIHDPNAIQSAAPAVPAAKKKKGVPMIMLFMIPMFLIVLLLFGGVLIYVVANRGKTNQANQLVIEQNDPGDEDPDDGPSKPPRTPAAQQTQQTGPTGPKEPGGGLTGPPPTISPTALTEEAGAKCLRAIAQNDPRAFLTSEQAKRVDDRIKQVKGFSGLAENINSARRNSKQIAEFASANNLKPSFLAIAAIARVGQGRGDVVAAARSMAEVFGKLGPQIGTERSDDALLMIAAYEQGVAGETMKMRNMLQDLANKNPESTREIRTIWFLEREGKITKQEFDRALTFLAIGSITQNPKAFGVNTEALNF